tara:strand:- start:1426 stop:1794 length:369 start_codon:yes stop_codon:yes gene_type:complete
MKNTNFYQPKKNAYNDRRRHWFKYVGESYMGFVEGDLLSYKCMSAATSLKHEALRTRVRDENIDKMGGSSWTVSAYTFRPAQERAFAKPKTASNKHREMSLNINRCERMCEVLSNEWLRVKL